MSINRCDSLHGGLATLNVPGIAQKRDFLPAMSVRGACSARGCPALVPWGQGPSPASGHRATAAAGHGGCRPPLSEGILPSGGLCSVSESSACALGVRPRAIAHLPHTEFIFEIKRQLLRLQESVEHPWYVRTFHTLKAVFRGGLLWWYYLERWPMAHLTFHLISEVAFCWWVFVGGFFLFKENILKN